MAIPQDLRLKVYAPALADGDRQVLEIVHRMERALPGLHLEWTISDEGQALPLAQRDEWVVRERRDGGFPLLCNDGDDHNLVTLNGHEDSARNSPWQALLEVNARLPLNATCTAAAPGVLEEVAEGARAYWGELTPLPAIVNILQQSRPMYRGPVRPPRGLPVLKRFTELRSLEIPSNLGWLNYWSAAAARAIGFPDLSRDADLLSRARRTATDGWVVRLTEAPLDLDNPAHLDVFLRAYERFPVIGGRAEPIAPPR